MVSKLIYGIVAAAVVIVILTVVLVYIFCVRKRHAPTKESSPPKNAEIATVQLEPIYAEIPDDQNKGLALGVHQHNTLKHSQQMDSTYNHLQLGGNEHNRPGDPSPATAYNQLQHEDQPRHQQRLSFGTPALNQTDESYEVPIDASIYPNHRVVPNLNFKAGYENTMMSTNYDYDDVIPNDSQYDDVAPCSIYDRAVLDKTFPITGGDTCDDVEANSLGVSTMQHTRSKYQNQPLYKVGSGTIKRNATSPQVNLSSAYNPAHQSPDNNFHAGEKIPQTYQQLSKGHEPDLYHSLNPNYEN